MAAPFTQALREDQAGIAQAQQYCTVGLRLGCTEEGIGNRLCASLTCDRPSRVGCRCSDADRLCPHSDRSIGLACGSLATILVERRPRCWSPPGAAYKHPRHLQRHLGVCRVQAAAMLVIKSGLAAHEHFHERPLFPGSYGFLLLLARRIGQRRLRDPGAFFPGRAARPARDASRIARSVAIDDPLELPASRWRRSRNDPRCLSSSATGGPAGTHAQHLRLLGGGINKALQQLVVRDALDARAHRLLAVNALDIGGAEHIEHGHHHRSTASWTMAHCAALPSRIITSTAVEALALMKTLFAADAHHGARIRAVRATAQRHLVHDRRAVDQPADGAHVAQVSAG